MEAIVTKAELFHNNGDGTFTDVAAEVGRRSVGFVKSASWGDYDNDGRLDLYVSKLNEPNSLLHNDGPRRRRLAFHRRLRQAGVGAPLDSFPTWFWDYDNDGWLDIWSCVPRLRVEVAE